MRLQRIPYFINSGTGGSVQKFAPPNAIGITGIIYSAPTVPIYPVQVSCGLISDDVSPSHDFIRYMASYGTKTSRGYQPLTQVGEQRDQIIATVTFISAQAGSPAESGKTSVWVEFLIREPNDPVGLQLPPTPFKCESGDNSETMVITQTSAATTAQQIDLLPTQGIEYTVVGGWMLTNTPSTATATLSWFDGTTAVTIDTTAAVASYAFNIGAKGSLPSIALLTGSTLGFRFAAGAAAAGTTTLYAIIRAAPKK